LAVLDTYEFIGYYAINFYLPLVSFPGNNCKCVLIVITNQRINARWWHSAGVEFDHQRDVFVQSQLHEDIELTMLVIATEYIDTFFVLVGR
jgi:hypothetical protein